MPAESMVVPLFVRLDFTNFLSFVQEEKKFDTAAASPRKTTYQKQPTPHTVLMFAMLCKFFSETRWCPMICTSTKSSGEADHFIR
jgi:hypothetical protein